MTSRRSLPRRSSGNSAALAVLLLLSLAVGARAAPSRGDDGPLQETRGGVTIDWQAGTLAATGGGLTDCSSVASKGRSCPFSCLSSHLRSRYRFHPVEGLPCSTLR